MFKIAICDDEIEELNKSLLYVTNHFESAADKATVDTFTDPKKLIDKIKENVIYDLYILDVLMGDVNGIDVAKVIKSFSKNAKIIFTTTSREFAVDAFAVQADNYLVKPYTQEDMDNALNRVIKAIPQNLFIIKNTSDGIKKIYLNTICYSESSGHYQYVHLDNKEVLKIRLKTNELWDELSKYKQFIRPHSGYIVNMDQVKTMTSFGMSVCDVDVPISKNTYNKVKRVFMEYTFNK